MFLRWSYGLSLRLITGRYVGLALSVLVWEGFEKDLWRRKVLSREWWSCGWWGSWIDEEMTGIGRESRRQLFGGYAQKSETVMSVWSCEVAKAICRRSASAPVWSCPRRQNDVVTRKAISSTSKRISLAQPAGGFERSALLDRRGNSRATTSKTSPNVAKLSMPAEFTDMSDL